MAVSFIRRGNQSTQWKPPTYRKSLTNTLVSFETLFVKFDLYRISFYSGLGLDNELYNQFNNQTNSADDYIDCSITGSDVMCFHRFSTWLRAAYLIIIIKRKFKQWRSIIWSISTKQTIASNSNPLNVKRLRVPEIRLKRLVHFWFYIT
jgi:hypothetical protein